MKSVINWNYCSPNRWARRALPTLRVLALGFNLLFMFFYTTLAQAQLCLRFQAHINTQAKVLGDVLIINDKSLAKRPLDSSPKANSIIRKEQIVTWLKLTDKQYQWKGKNRARIEAAAQSSSEQLIHKAEAALRAELEPYHLQKLQLVPKNKPHASEFPLSAFTVHMDKKYPPPQQLCVWLQYKKTAIPVWFKVIAYQKILVARTPLKSHRAVKQTEFMLKELNIAGLKNKPYQHLQTALWLKKTLHQNEVLDETHLKALPEVVKGQSVHLKIISQGVSITTEAIAQHDAYKGQKVSMRNPRSNKTFMALVTDLNQVEVHA